MSTVAVPTKTSHPYSNWYHPYEPDAQYTKRVAYFSMEFGIDQALKIYSGGLGFLAGSHMRSAYELKQNLIGIGMLWSFGYYDQGRDEENRLQVNWIRKHFHFLEDTGIRVKVQIHDNDDVLVKAYVLKPEVFGTVPVYLLTTDVDENDYLARSITHKLYDGNEMTRIAQSIVLGIGGAKVVDSLGGADIYHLNEAHGLPMINHLFEKYNNDIDEVWKRFVFTTHTPEKAGNEERDANLLNEMGFFKEFLPSEQLMEITDFNEDFNYTLTALKVAKIANGVSKIHAEVSNQMWSTDSKNVCDIIPITNAQNFKYWADEELWRCLENDDNDGIMARKRELKLRLFDVVADQVGKIMDPDVMTIVWARRFAGYKRADILFRDMGRFLKIIEGLEKPVQVIWAGKPYPLDQPAIDIFQNLIRLTQPYNNCAVLTGYELHLSKLLKTGSDIWLNTPRIPREASGTSGMTAAMNASVNLSTWDGWIPEFVRHGENGFVIPPVDLSKPVEEQDWDDCEHMYDILEKEVIPTYYDNRDQWMKIVKTSMREVVKDFSSNRMADEYYHKMYNI